MRTFGVAVALLAFATGAQASDWRKVAESPTVGSLLADIDSVERTDDTVSVWLKWPNYRSKFDPRVASATVRAEFYCAAGEFQIFEMVLMDKDERVLFDLMDQHGRNGTGTGTVYQNASKAVCSEEHGRR